MKCGTKKMAAGGRSTSMKQVANKAVKGHESRMHGKDKPVKMAKGGGYRSSCDGKAMRGKTKAK